MDVAIPLFFVFAVPLLAGLAGLWMVLWFIGRCSREKRLAAEDLRMLERVEQSLARMERRVQNLEVLIDRDHTRPAGAARMEREER